MNVILIFIFLLLIIFSFNFLLNNDKIYETFDVDSDSDGDGDSDGDSDGEFSNTMITLDDIINEYKIPENIYKNINEKITEKMQGNTFQSFFNDFMKSLRMEGFENKKTTILNIFICLIFIFLIYQMNKSV